jgi:protein SCO1/2
MSRRAVIVVLAALALAAVAGIVALAVAFLAPADGGAYAGSAPPAGQQLPEFELPDSTGATVRSRELGGKVVLVTFLDTQCRESCPIIAAALARGLDRLGAEERRDVVALGISVDPSGDDRESVREFLARHRAEERLRYLVADEDVLRPVWDEFGVVSSFDSGSDDLHSAPVRVYDREGTWVTTLRAGLDLTPDAVVHDIRLALGA